jgi:hypothetical protein
MNKRYWAFFASKVLAIIDKPVPFFPISVKAALLIPHLIGRMFWIARLKF